MSTKIYNGYRLPKWSLDELHSRCCRIRKAIQEAIQDEASTVHAKYCTAIIDRHAVGLPIPFDAGKSPATMVTAHFRERTNKIKASGVRDPEADFSFNFTIHPIEDKILCILFTERQKFFDIWEAFDFVKEYGYWNNIDRPDGLSEADWKTRETDWDAALNKTYTPSLSGFIVECGTSHFIMPAVDEILNKIPVFDARLKAVMDELMFDEFKPAGQTYGEKYREFNNYYKSESGKQRREQFKQEARARIPVEITADLLLNDLR